MGWDGGWSWLPRRMDGCVRWSEDRIPPALNCGSKIRPKLFEDSAYRRVVEEGWGGLEGCGGYHSGLLGRALAVAPRHYPLVARAAKAWNCQNRKVTLTLGKNRWTDNDSCLALLELGGASQHSSSTESCPRHHLRAMQPLQQLLYWGSHFAAADPMTKGRVKILGINKYFKVKLQYLPAQNAFHALELPRVSG